ncbi:sugar and other transporter-domain-containing protein [Aspergillus flavus]|uniref:Sugar and other transporter-domain-containing protein n=1 Tax=Aspergillus flavus (strain ATCC 200026 / FGSC A1120 / IAM 13836 / NRRL 3357 / JCM 12722 / SRRC 167) TaxID=332952 RepID=A0A7U2QWL1_ASPFN|nr:sugar and other transporter-domain-containing protein [Aspergillus flavus]
MPDPSSTRKPYFGLKGGWLIFWITIACATDMTLFGYDQVVFGGVIVTDDFLDVLHLDRKTSIISTVTAVYDVGCFFGAIASMILGEKLGQKKSILWGTIIMSTGAILQIAAYGVPQMIVGPTAPIWQGETSQAKWRGKLVAIELIMCIAGYSLSTWMTFSFSFLSGLVTWRFPLAFQFHTTITATVQYERENCIPWRAGSQTMQQLAEINVTSYYLTTLLIESVGLSNRLARLLTACKSISYLLSGIFAIPNIERFGRRQILMICSLGQGICYLLITVLIRFNEMEEYGPKQKVASASVAFFFYYLSFGCGFQGIPWLLPVELNSLSMRTKGVSIATATNWAFNFMVVEITPIGIKTLGWKFYIIWTVFNFSSIPLIYFFYPETPNRPLEDIDRFFIENKGLLIIRNPDATSANRRTRYIECELDIMNAQDKADAAHMEIVAEGKA